MGDTRKRQLCKRLHYANFECTAWVWERGLEGLGFETYGLL